MNIFIVITTYSQVQYHSVMYFSHVQGYQAEDNPVQHAALMENKMDGSRRRRDNTWSECVYLSVKQ